MNSIGAKPLLAFSDRQDLYSMAYIKAISATAGYIFGKPEIDRNCDDIYLEFLENNTFIPRYPRLKIQVKCTYAHSKPIKGFIKYPLDIRTYDILRQPKIEPRIICVVTVPNPEIERGEPWIECFERHTILRYKAYWLNIMGKPETANTRSITLDIPIINIITVESMHQLMSEFVEKGNKSYGQ
jgi:hypothetical protein